MAITSAMAMATAMAVAVAVASAKKTVTSKPNPITTMATPQQPPTLPQTKKPRPGPRQRGEKLKKGKKAKKMNRSPRLSNSNHDLTLSHPSSLKWMQTRAIPMRRWKGRSNHVCEGLSADL
jgi:hypothetical protein